MTGDAGPMSLSGAGCVFAETDIEWKVMRTTRKTHGAAALFTLLFLLSYPARSQVVVGQYEDEAPVRSWNNFGLLTAQATAMGGSRFALAGDASVSLCNPAALTRLPKFTVTLNGSLNRASFFRYALVNTGPLFTAGNVTIQIYSWDYAGLSYSFRGWHIALNLALTEYYYRPGMTATSSFGGQAYRTLEFEQEGVLQTINFAAARKIGSRLSIGLGFNLFRGFLDRLVGEKYEYSGITITDTVQNDFSGFALNGGVIWDATGNVSLAAVFRAPYTKKAESRSVRSFISPETDLSSVDDASGSYRQPLILGAGVHYKITPNLRVASDLSFFNWGRYSVDSFGEKLDRPFKNVLKFSIGAEYLGSIRLFGKEARLPLRIGFSYDPQPVAEPGVRYVYGSLGTGLHSGRFSVDLAALIGREFGTGNDLGVQKFVLTVSYKQ